MQETWVRSLGWEDSPGEGKGYPPQYSDLEKSMDCIVHGVMESDTTEWHSLSHALEEPVYLKYVFLIKTLLSDLFVSVVFMMVAAARDLDC